MASATYTSFLIGYALLATALLAGLYLFFSLKRDIQRAARQQEQRLHMLAERLQQAEQPLLLEAGPAEASLGAMAYPSAVNTSSANTSASTVRAGFNLNKRVQAMRLLRRGENISHIAAVLAVPRKEVELLIRVQQMTALAPPAISNRSGIQSAAPSILPRAHSAAAGSVRAALDTAPGTAQDIAGGLAELP